MRCELYVRAPTVKQAEQNISLPDQFCRPLSAAKAKTAARSATASFIAWPAGRRASGPRCDAKLSKSTSDFRFDPSCGSRVIRRETGGNGAPTTVKSSTGRRYEPGVENLLKSLHLVDGYSIGGFIAQRQKSRLRARTSPSFSLRTLALECRFDRNSLKTVVAEPSH